MSLNTARTTMHSSKFVDDAGLPMPTPSVSSSKLPDEVTLESFTSFGQVAPGTLPLLVQMPDGMREQIDVPMNYSVNDIKQTLQRQASDESGILSSARMPPSTSDFHLSFGNADLDPTATLMDTNIPSAYEHAGSLLQVINSATHPDPETKSAALDSACAVVERISNGIKDMELLCEAATNINTSEVTDITNEQTTQNQIQQQQQQQQQAQQQHPNSNHSNHHHHQQQQHHLTVNTNTNFNSASPPQLTPSSLAHNLSRQLPDLFPPEAAEKTHPTPSNHEQNTTGTQQQQQQQQQQQGEAPSITELRNQRNKFRAERGERPSPSPMQSDDNIGFSTYDQAIPNDILAPSTKKTGNAAVPNVILAQSSGRTTWFDDLITTTEVNTVRQSGVLEKSKDGQAVREHLQQLEEEARNEAQTLNDSDFVTDSRGDDAAGETVDVNNANAASSDEDEDDEEDDGDKDSSMSTSTTATTTTTGTTTTSNHLNNNNNVHQHPYAPQQQQQQQQQQQPLLQRSNHDPFNMQQSIPHQQQQQQQPLTRAPPPFGHQFASPSPTTSGSSNSGVAPVRRLAKIAPAPTAGATPMPGGGSGAMFQGVPPPPGTWSKALPTPGQKKRGRKRKNPQLTEEERALVRKEQNRESARLSRVRRKVIAAEYEGKLSELVNENSALRKQVEGLNNRLVYLQSILTVTVRAGEAGNNNNASNGNNNAASTS